MKKPAKIINICEGRNKGDVYIKLNPVTIIVMVLASILFLLTKALI